MYYYGIHKALIDAADALAGRKLSDADKQRLIDLFEKEVGSQRDRATRALGQFLNMTPEQIRTRAASNDNADRKIKDLEDLLNR